MVVKPADSDVATRGSTTLTTLPARNAIPDPRIVAMSTQRAAGVPARMSPTPRSTPGQGVVLPVPNAFDIPCSAAVSSVGTTHTFDDSDAAICGSVWRYW